MKLRFNAKISKGDEENDDLEMLYCPVDTINIPGPNYYL